MGGAVTRLTLAIVATIAAATSAARGAHLDGVPYVSDEERL